MTIVFAMAVTFLPQNVYAYKAGNIRLSKKCITMKKEQTYKLIVDCETND